MYYVLQYATVLYEFESTTFYIILGKPSMHGRHNLTNILTATIYYVNYDIISYRISSYYTFSDHVMQYPITSSSCNISCLIISQRFISHLLHTIFTNDQNLSYHIISYHIISYNIILIFIISHRVLMLCNIMTAEVQGCDEEILYTEDNAYILYIILK